MRLIAVDNANNFTLEKSAIVIEDNNILAERTASRENMAKILFHLAKEYNVFTLSLRDESIKDDLSYLSIAEYGTNKFEFV